MVQSIRDLEFIIFILVRVGGIIDMGPGQVLGLNSFSGYFKCCTKVAKWYYSGIWKHGL